MIEVHDLRKTYGELVAVDGVSFVADQGSIFGLLGPNGAGKSTTIGCISGLLQPTGGRVSALSHDVTSDRRAARQELARHPPLQSLLPPARIPAAPRESEAAMVTAPQ